MYFAVISDKENLNIRLSSHSLTVETGIYLKQDLFIMFQNGPNWRLHCLHESVFESNEFISENEIWFFLKRHVARTPFYKGKENYIKIKVI